MLNLIRMNLYRFLREKTYISLIVIMLCSVFVSAVVIELATDESVQVTKTVDENGQELYTMEKVDEENGLELSMQSESGPDITIAEIFAGILGSVMTMISGIYAVIYSDTERRQGFVKNLTVRKRERVSVFAAKAVPVLLYDFLCMVAILAGIFIANSLAYNVPFGDIAGFGRYFGVQLMLSTAFGIFALAIYELIRREVVAVIVVIFTALGLVGKIVQLLEMGLVEVGIFSETFVEKYEITQHMLAYRSGMISPVDQNAGTPCALIVAMMGMAVYLAVGMILYRRKDVV